MQTLLNSPKDSPSTGHNSLAPRQLQDLAGCLGIHVECQLSQCSQVPPGEACAPGGGRPVGVHLAADVLVYLCFCLMKELAPVFSTAASVSEAQTGSLARYHRQGLTQQKFNFGGWRFQVKGSAALTSPEIPLVQLWACPSLLSVWSDFSPYRDTTQLGATDPSKNFTLT